MSRGDTGVQAYVLRSGRDSTSQDIEAVPWSEFAHLPVVINKYVLDGGSDGELQMSLH